MVEEVIRWSPDRRPQRHQGKSCNALSESTDIPLGLGLGTVSVRVRVRVRVSAVPSNLLLVWVQCGCLQREIEVRSYRRLRFS